MGFAQIRSSGALLAAAIALAILPVSGITAKGPTEPCAAKPLVVKIHAAWCATCKFLDATWAQIRIDLSDRATLVELDVTDRTAYRESLAEAERLGIADFFQKYRSKTGTIAVLDCTTHEPVVVLRGERNIAKYREAVARAGRSS